MSKIINIPKFKVIKCSSCGCEYEYEEGDSVTEQRYNDGPFTFYNGLELPCPVCGCGNELVVKDE